MYIFPNNIKLLTLFVLHPCFSYVYVTLTPTDRYLYTQLTAVQVAVERWNVIVTDCILKNRLSTLLQIITLCTKIKT